MLEAQARTLFGWPREKPASEEAGGLCVIGAPTDRGNGICRGAARAPNAIREASLHMEAPAPAGVDWGDLRDAQSLDLVPTLGRLGKLTALAVSRRMCPLILGGDHSISYAPVEALQSAEPLCLVWFDAHTDFSPWCGQGSHNHKQVLRRIAALEGVVRIVQIGHRGLTTGDERWLGEKATVVSSAQARALDEASLLALIPANLRCYVSIDIDLVDPLYAPGTSAPVPDGLRPDETVSMVGSIVRNRPAIGFDVVEVNPRLDVRGMTSRVAASILGSIAENRQLRRASGGPDYRSDNVGPVHRKALRNGRCVG